jgi:hypothetical protein
VDLKICSTRFLVGVIYTPPKIDGYPFYGPILEKLTSIYSRFIVMGVEMLVHREFFLEQLNGLSVTVIINVRSGERPRPLIR